MDEVAGRALDRPNEPLGEDSPAAVSHWRQALIDLRRGLGYLR
jgi:hypothetical protein